jgi:hypothetical protein
VSTRVPEAKVGTHPARDNSFYFAAARRDLVEPRTRADFSRRLSPGISPVQAFANEGLDIIIPDFKNQREAPFHPARRTTLFRYLASLSQKIPMTENLFCAGKFDSAPAVFTEFPVLASIKVESQAGITLMPYLWFSPKPKRRRIGAL